MADGHTDVCREQIRVESDWDRAPADERVDNRDHARVVAARDQQDVRIRPSILRRVGLVAVARALEGDELPRVLPTRNRRRVQYQEPLGNARPCLASAGMSSGGAAWSRTCSSTCFSSSASESWKDLKLLQNLSACYCAISILGLPSYPRSAEWTSVGLTTTASAGSTPRGPSRRWEPARSTPRWGLNHVGQAGLGASAGSPTALAVTGAARGQTAVAAGWYHSLAVDPGGTVSAWAAPRLSPPARTTRSRPASGRDGHRSPRQCPEDQ